MSFTSNFQEHSRTPKFLRASKNSYEGPELESIDENLSEMLEEYFESLGVNEEVIAFIEQYSVDAEHPFYVKWLEDIRTFVK